MNIFLADLISIINKYYSLSLENVGEATHGCCCCFCHCVANIIIKNILPRCLSIKFSEFQVSPSCSREMLCSLSESRLLKGQISRGWIMDDEEGANGIIILSLLFRASNFLAFYTCQIAFSFQFHRGKSHASSFRAEQVECEVGKQAPSFPLPFLHSLSLPFYGILCDL
jgi:hypothetical protein